MKINVRKVIVTSLVGFCLWLSAERVHDFYVEKIPVGAEGTCFSIKYPQIQDRYLLRILKNDNQESTSLVAISLFNEPNTFWLDKFTYMQLRMIDPRKIKCD